MLYRFRDIEKLVNEPYEELKKQYFYFASPDSLNDPLEGYVDFYWQGNKIAWLGLFKNYVWQVCFAFFNFYIGCTAQEIQNMYFSRSEIHMKDTDFLKIRSKLENDFANESMINEIASILGESGREISQNELQYVLLSIHGIAMFYANKTFESICGNIFGTLKIFKKNESIKKEQKEKTIDIIKKICAGNSDVGLLLTIINNTRLTESIQTTSKEETQEKIEFMFFDFPNSYSKHVIDLAYQAWYTVCFNSSYEDPKMWSHYADNHKGVCMIFDFGDTGYVDLEPINSNLEEKKKHFAINSIDYNRKPSKVNFFETLGNLFGDEREHWFFHNGEKSSTLTTILSDVEKWRTEYWSEFQKRFLRKSSAWASEQEKRIVLDDTFYDHTDVEQRKFKYEFEQLHGIIFGINTTLSNKQKIIRVLQEKRKEIHRKPIQIYQARFDEDKEKIQSDFLMEI